MSRDRKKRERADAASDQTRIGVVDVPVLVEYLDELLNSHQNESRKFKIRSYTMGFFGTSMSAMCFIPQFGLTVPDWMKVGPALLMLALSGYQYMAMLSSSKDLVSYRFYRRQLGQCIDKGVQPSEWLLERLKKI